MARRTVYDIYADVLRYVAIRPGCRISYIARYSNLPLDRANRVLMDMVKANLIRLEYKRGVKTYTVTERGYEYLELYKRLKRLLSPILGEEL